MKSFRGSDNSLVNTFATLSLNASTANATLATILLNEQHKQLVLKYFDTERSFTMLTTGGTTATFTGTVPAGATTATLSVTWPTSNISCQQLTTFASGDQRNAFFTQGSATITWQSPLSIAGGTSASLAGVQFYPLPANVSKIKNSTITLGQLVYSPAPVQTIQEWTQLNALPYSSNIPAYFYIYNNQIGFWPIPSTSGQVITLNCQVGVGDMTYADYNTGLIANGGMVVGSNIITGSGTSWTNYPQNVDLTFANLFLTALPPYGDGTPYQIQKFTSATSATLLKPVVYNPNEAGSGTYVIGQYPLLSPDFHDAIVYGALRIYFASIVKDSERYALYEKLYGEKLKLIEFYLANKTVNVDLSVSPVITNPNLFPANLR